MKKQFLFSFLLFLSVCSFSQDNVITGTVKSGEDLETLLGVNITIKGTIEGTVTDVNGNYSITVPDTNTVLVFSYIGFLSEEVPVKSQTAIDVQLIPDLQVLNEVVKIGYGSQKKSDLTGAITQIKSEDIIKRPVATIEQAIQGQAAGVRVTMPSGAPGSEAKVVIRGQGSINPVNNPLYIVDGIALTSGISSLNTNDIESIEVLKDASASAIYGARGSNGVVLITTKKGSSGKMKVDFSMFYGTQEPWKTMDLMNGQQWAETQNQGLVNDNSSLKPNPDTWDTLTGATRLGIQDSTDWQDAMFQKGIKQNYYLSFSGGTEKSNFLASFGYFDHVGVIPNSFYKKFTIRFNSSHKMKDWLTMGNNLAIMRTQTRRVTENGDRRSTILNILRSSPLIYHDYKEEEGYWGGSVDSKYYGEPNNPYRMAQEENGDYYTNYLIGNVFLDIKLFKDLTFHTDFGLEYSMDDWKNFHVPYLEYQYRDGSSVPTLSKAMNERRKWETKNYFNYTKNFGGKHDLTLLLGGDRESYYAEYFSGYRGGFIVGDIEELEYLSLGADSTAKVDGTGEDWSLASYYFRAIYSYDDRYLFTGSVRMDGSSKFRDNGSSIFSGDNPRWGTFPSFSLGWKLSNEAFLQDVNFISLLKLRFGWGQIGNERGATNYPTYSVVIPGTPSWSAYYIFGPGQDGQLGLYPERMPNELLHWETSQQTNFGLDMSMWENRISLTADYFIKTNKDMIMPLQLPEVGRGQQANPIANVGTVRNQGLELTVNFRNKTGDFYYNAGFNFTTTKNNEIIDMAGSSIDGPNYQSLGITTKTVEGRSIGLFYGYVWDGIFQSEEEIEQHADQKDAQPGDFRFRDIDGDRKITEADRTFIGNPLPDFIYGITLGCEYKGIDLSIFLQGSQGNDILNLSRYETDFLHGDNYTNNFTTDLLNAWTEDNQSTTVGRLTKADKNNNYRISSYYVEDGSYLRIKNIQLGYSLPQKWLEKVKIERVRVYISSENLATFTKYKGFDPEVGASAAYAGTVFGTGYGIGAGGGGDSERPLSAVSRGVDMGVFPQVRTYLFGVNVTF